MGKRSGFKRIEKDFYETPVEGIVALIPHLPNNFVYDDPCYGTGNIPLHLRELHPGAHLHSYFDLYPRLYYSSADKADATTHQYQKFADIFITNPVWSRPDLHRIIDNLCKQKPTWLLFDADWMHTRQEIMANKHNCKSATELRKYLVKIVSVGRLKWMPGSKHVGKDNACWYLFDQSRTRCNSPKFIGP